MNYQEIQKMFEKYKTPFRTSFMHDHDNACWAVVDHEAELVVDCYEKLDAELICFCLNFTANAFSVIREN